MNTWMSLWASKSEIASTFLSCPQFKTQQRGKINTTFFFFSPEKSHIPFPESDQLFEV